MRVDRFTSKMREALQAAASKSNHSQIDNEHFLLALLEQTDGVVCPLLEKLGVSLPSLESRLQEALAKRAQISGGAQVGLILLCHQNSLTPATSIL